jgi:hypothetical protein
MKSIDQIDADVDADAGNKKSRKVVLFLVVLAEEAANFADGERV